MKLKFRLLIADDAPDSIEQAIATLGEHLEEKGFTLKLQVENDFSQENLNSLASSGGQEYDLVVVDYMLGSGINGADVAGTLRRKLPYTDMVFYSSNPAADLLGELASHGIPGVFTSTRNELDESLKGLADTVIGKAVDLNHMRGIAMAEVAEMDLLMEETLVRAFSSSNPNAVAAADRTGRKLLDSICRAKNKVRERLSAGGMALAVKDGRLAQHTQKYWAIKRLARHLTDAPTEHLSTLTNYESEIISNRNLLAHAKEQLDVSGRTQLCSVGRNQEPISIDELWMADYRRKLQKHRQALDVICSLIDRDLTT